MRPGVRAGSDDNDFVGQHTPNVFLAPVPVGLPSVGAVEALGLFVALLPWCL